MEDVQQVTFAPKEQLHQHLAQQEATTKIQGNPHAQHVRKGNIAQRLHWHNLLVNVQQLIYVGKGQ